MPPAEFEPAIPVSESPETLDRPAIGIGFRSIKTEYFINKTI
jgi:hypothetical protein